MEDFKSCEGRSAMLAYSFQSGQTANDSSC